MHEARLHPHKARLHDLEGNPIELWQPLDAVTVK
jgi:hypothetical protein